MATSVVDICNSSLIHLGEELISLLTENNDRARACNQFYANARDAVLTQAEWNFATTQQELSKLTAVPLFKYDLAYALPTLPYCLKPLRLEDDDLDDNWKQRGRELHTDRDGVKLEYIFRNEDVSMFTPLFEEALAYYLSAKMAYTLTGSRAVAQDMYALYDSLLADAADVDAQVGEAEQFEADDFINART